MKMILVSVTNEETRMAIVTDGQLSGFELERPSHSHLVGNIYSGKVQNVLPGMQAAFVDIGFKKNAFLYIGDGMPPDVMKSFPEQSRIHIGQILSVQVVKDAIGMKGPRVTTHLSIPGRNVVLMPTAGYIGLSRRIAEEERKRLKDIAEEICPEGMGIIVRTVAEGQTKETLAEEVRYLKNLWESISAKRKRASAPALLFRDADLLIRLIRDQVNKDIDSIIVDDAEAEHRARELLNVFSPGMNTKLELYSGAKSLFEAYGIEEQLKTLNSRMVKLKSGGFLVFDHTEALTVIDVNTGKFTGRDNLGNTVFNVNLEAAHEIMRQIYLRDIGGIIIVDFIDMEKETQKEELLQLLRELSVGDRKKTNIFGITALGLVEITRKKTRENMESLLYSDCPCCSGSGKIISAESVAVQICNDIRKIEHHTHAPFGYDVELNRVTFEALMDSEIISQLSHKLQVHIELRKKDDIYPGNYVITRRSQ